MVRLVVLEFQPEVVVPTVGSTAPAGVIDTGHPDDAARAKFRRPGPFPMAALCWTVVGAAPPDVPTASGPTFDLVEHVGWLAPADEIASTDPADVVKQVSFLHASTGVTIDEFRAHYRDHVALARRLMPSLWQYIQYDVHDIQYDVHEIGGDRADRAHGVVAVSVLWFKTTADFVHRYFLTPDDAEEFRSHEGFLDLTKAITFVGTSHPTSGPAARP